MNSYSEQIKPGHITAYSVREITRLIKQKLETSFPNVWIEGEISNLKKAATGHVYFTLKDEFSQISAVIFRSSAERYCGKDIFDGIKIRVFGNISVYEKSGNYQIICSKIEKTGLGDLQLKFLQLKEKLFKLGWFDSSLKKPVPFIPERIAIITSGTGAAVRDMLNIIYTRWPNMNVIVFPVKVQGEGAAEEIAFAVNKINELKLASVMIVGRGGGSIEDLWAFNEFIVAEAIHYSQIPVISAVGHEIDFTIADFVADYRAETPSAAAVAVIPRQNDLLEMLNSRKITLYNNVKNKISNYMEIIKAYKNHYCFREPLNQIKQFYQRVDELSLSLKKAVINHINMKNENLKRVTHVLKSLSPYNILERGYSITVDKTGKTIKNVHDISIDMEIMTVLTNGKINSRVTDIVKDK